MYKTDSMDLPASLSNMLNVGGTPAAPMAGINPAPSGLSSAMTGQQSMIPSYQAGGMIGPGGTPRPPEPQQSGMGVGVSAATPQGPMPPQMIEGQLNQFMRQNPQQVAQIRQVMMQAMQQGQFTQEELNMLGQLAQVAVQNPSMYPYVRRFAIQQGILSEQEMPQQFDQGLLFVILLAARAFQQDMGGQNMMQGGSPRMAGGPSVTPAQVTSGAPSMAMGGTVPDSKKSDGSVLINAHEGEYVIPRNVVEMKGKEFFDNLVEKYKER